MLNNVYAFMNILQKHSWACHLKRKYKYLDVIQKCLKSGSVETY